MIKELYVQQFYPVAKAAGELFRINPVVILAQSAIESGWGESHLSRHNNYFGICGFGKPNRYWDGAKIQLCENGLVFRKYKTIADGFNDFARLIRSSYKTAADVSFASPQAYAQEIAYSRYISEVNGDNRAAYKRMLISISADVEKIIATQFKTEEK